MPKAATHALIWSAQSKTYTLLCPDSQPQSLVSGNEESWLAWLATHSSFSFQGQCGQLSVLKESRQRGEGYWYAYHTTQSVTRKRYLGRATMVTLERLEKVAHELSRSPSPAMRALVTAKLPVLATYGIRPPNKAFENTQSGLLLLVDSEAEEYNLKHSSIANRCLGCPTTTGSHPVWAWSARI